MKKPQCSKCHRVLTDPFSIAVGMGPECRGGLSKKGWKFPKPKYKVKNGRVTLLGLVGNIERPPVHVESAEAMEKKKTRVVNVNFAPKLTNPEIVSGIRDRASAAAWGEKHNYDVVYFWERRHRAYADRLQVRVDAQAEIIEDQSAVLLDQAEMAKAAK